MRKEIEKLLQSVQKPARYAGGELNSVMKDKSKVALRYAFCFPDTYEIGMSAASAWRAGTIFSPAMCWSAMWSRSTETE